MVHVMSIAEMSLAKFARTNSSVGSMICEQILAQPGAVAIATPSRELSYGELGSLADGLARRLRHLEIGKGDVVAICLPASAEFISAALATMMAGAAYLPIEQNCPTERIAFLVGDSGARLLITSSKLPSEPHVTLP